MGDDKEAVKHAEGERGHGNEIHRSDGFPMIARKAAHRFAGSEFRGALRIQRKTVRSEMSKPSIFSSP
jgi:hypothetical protein